MTDNNRTMTPGNATKLTELPEGCQLLLVDSSGEVLERMEAERFMELLRASIQIGGRNLIKNSEQFSFKSADNNFYFRVIGEGLKVKAGDLFTATFGSVTMTGSDSQRFQVSIYDDTKKLTLAKFTLGPDAKAVTAEVSADCDDARILLYTGIPGDTANKSLEVTNLKLERGNIASDWTPAPEDFMEVGGGNLLANSLLQICAISPESTDAFKNNSNR